MSEVAEDQKTGDRPACSNELDIHGVEDDSLDAQISLLESTLTESNEGLQNFINLTNDEETTTFKRNPELVSLECFNENTSTPATCDAKCEWFSSTSDEIKSRNSSPSPQKYQSTYDNKCLTSEANLSSPTQPLENYLNGKLSSIKNVKLNSLDIKYDKSQTDSNEDNLDLGNQSTNRPNSTIYPEVETVISLEKDSMTETKCCNSQDSVVALVAKEAIVSEFKDPQVSKDIGSCSDKIVSLDAKYISSMPVDNVKMEDNTNEVDELQPSRVKVFCSTPNNFKKVGNTSTSEEVCVNNIFGQITPLNKKRLSDKNEINLKRKRELLECIEEVDENVSNSSIEKKLKYGAPSNEPNLEELQAKVETNESENKSFIPCYEAPAKSIWKKLQSSNLARSASSSYLIIDECGESDVEDTNTVSSQHSIEGEEVDDFEIACKSLTEELMKCSSNIENIEQFQELTESQIDVDKLDDYLQELSQNYDLGEKTSLTMKTMEESLSTEQSVSDLDKTIVENVSNIDVLINVETDRNTMNMKQIIEQSQKAENKVSIFQSDSLKENQNDVENDKEHANNDGIQNALRPDTIVIDEEDTLLEEANEKKKPYVFFEFVSENPKENEDNYNPEWQKLGRLTSDEERYKAVRDRWRSLVPPDPNRNLTLRQWRKKNNKAPLRILSNNNHHMGFEDGEKTQLCTAVYQNQISKLQQELRDKTFRISDRMNQEFDRLGMKQDAQQRSLVRQGGTGMDLAKLHRRHIEECQSLKYRYEKERQQQKFHIESKMNRLKEASEEVLLFQKYYRGVGATDDSACLYSDVQVQELIETEEMVDKYSEFYRD